MKYLAIFLLLTSYASNACRPTGISLSEQVSQADSIYIAHVIGVNLNGYESQLKNSEEEIIRIPEPKTFKLYHSENIKGEGKEYSFMKTSGCSSLELKEKVILFVNSDYSDFIPYSEKNYKKVLNVLNLNED